MNKKITFIAVFTMLALLLVAQVDIGPNEPLDYYGDGLIITTLRFAGDATAFQGLNILSGPYAPVPDSAPAGFSFVPTNEERYNVVGYQWATVYVYSDELYFMYHLGDEEWIIDEGPMNNTGYTFSLGSRNSLFEWKTCRLEKNAFHTISGTFTSTEGFPFDNIDLTATGIAAEDIFIDTDTGSYTITVPDGWDGTVTPTLLDPPGFICHTEPTSMEYTDVEQNTPNQDYVIICEIDETLPVELSSFTVALNVHNNAEISWVTQSETEMSGYHIYRNGEKDLPAALLICDLIPATNSSQEHTYLHIDKELSEMGTYYYWLQASDLDGSESFFGPITLTYEADEQQTPELTPVTCIKNIFPNPFNPNTNISYTLVNPANVRFAILNSRGQLVKEVNLGNKDAGDYTLAWDGNDDTGKPATTGVYFFRMLAGDKSFSRKAILMK